MPNPRTIAAMLAAGLLAASAGRAANHGVPLLPGDRFTAEVSPAGDVDAFVVPLATGSRLNVDVRAAAGSSLHPDVRLLSPAGDEAVLGSLVRGGGTSRVTFRNVPILTTGEWAVTVGGEGVTAGAYEIAVTAKSPTRFARKGLAVPAGEVGSLPFAAGEGYLLTFVLKSRGGTLPAGVVIRDPAGEEIAIPEGAVVTKGTKFTGRNIPLSGPYGTWELRVVASQGGNALVDATLQVRAPKARKLRATLGPEPRPLTLSPSAGRDGTPFSVGGSGFDPGAGVRFGESWAAVDGVAGGTTITGSAPDGSEATGGLQVTVYVVNPDGQENPVPAHFQFLGIPKPESVDPVFQPPEGGYPLVITGLNFRPGFSLSIDGIPRPEATLSALGEILCTSPPHGLGTAPIAVTDEFGRTGILPSGVTYIAAPVPLSVTPGSSSFSGGRMHVLVGTSFRPGLEVFVDGAPCEDVSFTDSNHLRFRMPAGPAGTFDVAVHDEFGRTNTGAGLVRRRGPFVDDSAAAVPPAPAGNEFFGTSISLGDLDGDAALGPVPDILITTPTVAYDYYTYLYMPATQVLLNGGAGAFTDGTSARLAGFAHANDFGQGAFALLGDLDGQPGHEVVISSVYPSTSPYGTFQKNGKTYAYATLGYYGSPYVDYRTYFATRILAGKPGETLADATAQRMPASASTPFAGFGERWQAAAGALGDLDGDGDKDMVLAAPGFLVTGTVSSTTYTGGVNYLIETYAYAASTRILRNDGTGTFAPRAGDMPAVSFMNGNYANRVAEEFDSSAVALGDLDGDGDRDLVLARAYPKLVYHLDAVSGNYSIYYLPALRLLRNDGTGKFVRDASAVPVPEGNQIAGSPEFWQGTTAALGDLDGDGDLDLVLGRPTVFYWYDAATTAYRLLPAIRLFSNNGAGVFTEDTGTFLPAASFLGGGPDTVLDARAVALGDLDGDGSLDMVVAGQAYYVYSYAGAPYGPNGFLKAGEHPATRVFVNDGKGRFADLTAEWMPKPVNGDLFQSDAAALGDLDGDGDLDLVLASNYYPYSSATPYGTYNRPLRILKCK